MERKEKEKKEEKVKAKQEDGGDEDGPPPPPPPLEFNVHLKLHHWQTAMDSLQTEEEQSDNEGQVS